MGGHDARGRGRDVSRRESSEGFRRRVFGEDVDVERGSGAKGRRSEKSRAERVEESVQLVEDVKNVIARESRHRGGMGENLSKGAREGAARGRGSRGSRGNGRKVGGVDGGGQGFGEVWLMRLQRV